MNDPLTIDKYPTEVHNRFAQDQIQFDSHLIEESHFIPYQTEIGVVDPIFSPEHDALFEITQKSPTWAAFTPPPGYSEQSKRFFGYQIISGIDPHAAAELFYEELEKYFLKKKQKLSENQIGRPKKKVIALLEVIEVLNQLLSEIRARIHQYAKG